MLVLECVWNEILVENQFENLTKRKVQTVDAVLENAPTRRLPRPDGDPAGAG
jgi:hypothetical protein